MEAKGIIDEEEILRRKKEKEAKLRENYDQTIFDQKYLRDLKMRAEKKQRMEEEKMQKEKEQNTFRPELQKTAKSRQSISKSPVQMIREQSSHKAQIISYRQLSPSKKGLLNAGDGGSSRNQIAETGMTPNKGFNQLYRTQNLNTPHQPYGVEHSPMTMLFKNGKAVAKPQISSPPPFIKRNQVGVIK